MASVGEGLAEVGRATAAEARTRPARTATAGAAPPAPPAAARKPWTPPERRRPRRRRRGPPRRPRARSRRTGVRHGDGACRDRGLGLLRGRPGHGDAVAAGQRSSPPRSPSWRTPWSTSSSPWSARSSGVLHLHARSAERGDAAGGPGLAGVAAAPAAEATAVAARSAVAPSPARRIKRRRVLLRLVSDCICRDSSFSFLVLSCVAFCGCGITRCGGRRSGRAWPPGWPGRPRRGRRWPWR